MIALVGLAGVLGGAVDLFDIASLPHTANAAALLAPIAMLLAALNFSGAYTPEAVTRPGRALGRVCMLWALLQVSVFATLSSLHPDVLAIDHGVIAFALLAPATLLPQRGVCALLLRRATPAGGQRARVFLVAETPESAEAYPQKHGCGILPSLTEADPDRLQQLLADIISSGCDEIHILPRSSGSVLGTELVRALRLASAPIRLIASSDQERFLRYPVSRVGTGFAFDIERPRLRLSDRLLKRALDVTAATALCAFVAPLLLVVAIAVRCSSRGPALFRQPRIGRDGHVFLIYKFRTMMVQETGLDVVQAIRGDARVTLLGRFLRASSIDELPQLFNVLSGEMSLVGPRPHAVIHDRDFASRVEDYRLRQIVKPGLTGLAQVSGARGEVQDASALFKRVSLDLKYIEDWSIALDLKIILRTVMIVFDFRKTY